jgi:4-hydroxybenzoate polyprenyltransferase
MRPHQYVKNIFIFLPIFFAMKISDMSALTHAFIAFIAFSLVSSSIYVLNDYFDIEADKLHPKKRNRPLASGAISKNQARKIMAILFGIGMLLILTISLKGALILLFYALMNIAYSIKIKHISIIDIITIAVGFVLRLFVGSAVTGIVLSKWIVIIVFLLALFLALAKRRDDVLIYMKDGLKMRKVIENYNLQFLDTAMSIMASVVIVSYLLYVTSPEVVARIHSDYLYLTAFFVILGVMRYLQIAFVFQDSGAPTKIVLKDRFIKVTIIGWILTFAWILY